MFAVLAAEPMEELSAEPRDERALKAREMQTLLEKCLQTVCLGIWRGEQTLLDTDRFPAEIAAQRSYEILSRLLPKRHIHCILEIAASARFDGFLNSVSFYGTSSREFHHLRFLSQPNRLQRIDIGGTEGLFEWTRERDKRKTLDLCELLQKWLPRFRNLKVLNIATLALSFKKEMLKNLPLGLTQISIGKCDGLSNSSLEMFSALNCLERLNLSGNLQLSWGFSKLLPSLANSLTHLEISQTSFGTCPQNFACFKDMQKLNCLDLSFSSGSEPTPADYRDKLIEEILLMMYKFNTLECLKLSHNYLDFRNWNYLKECDLSRKTFSSLLELDISHNPFGLHADEGEQSQSPDMLRSFPCITKLNIDGITPERVFRFSTKEYSNIESFSCRGVDLSSNSKNFWIMFPS